MNRWMDKLLGRQIERWIDRWISGQMERWRDRRMDGRTGEWNTRRVQTWDTHPNFILASGLTHVLRLGAALDAAPDRH